MYLPSSLSEIDVTTTQIILATTAVISSAVVVGGVIYALSRTMTEFRLGIKSLSGALDRLTDTMDKGFSAVHDRLDRGETKINSHDRRIIRLELANGIDVQEH